MTRKMLAKEAGVSERHLATWKQGSVTHRSWSFGSLPKRLNCTIAEFAGEEPITSPEWLLIRQLLKGRDEQGLKQARQTLPSCLVQAHSIRRGTVGSRWSGSRRRQINAGKNACR
jgi:XRE family aerobic/anaerobic benzoate catabolism transcriptional regulator